MRKRLDNLLYLADKAAADYILLFERVKTSELRIATYEREERHLCMRPGCTKPTVGRRVFMHCEDHLNLTEHRWLSEDIETKGFSPVSDNPIDVHFSEIEISQARKSIKTKEDALTAAYQIQKDFDEMESERNRLLPPSLLNRLRDHEADLVDKHRQ